MDFLDVTGASGATYRFRRIGVDALPATAGNLLVVAGAPSRLSYRLCAAARSLNTAGAAIAPRLAEVRGAKLFVRLNVSRVVRDAEHADIVAAVRPETDLPDLE
jgi:hypothetical protein